MEDNIQNPEETSDELSVSNSNEVTGNGSILTDSPVATRTKMSIWIFIVLIGVVLVGVVFFLLMATTSDSVRTESSSQNTDVLPSTEAPGLVDGSEEYGRENLEQTEVTSDSIQAIPTNDEHKKNSVVEFNENVNVVTYDDPDEVSSISLYSLREFVNRVYSLTVDAAPTESVTILADNICNHEYLQPTVDRYKHELTCIQDSDTVRFSAPYMFDTTSYCTDSSGFSGLVINFGANSKLLCSEAFLQMRPFNANEPDLARINSFNLPEFNKIFSSNDLNQEGYEKLKQYYGKNYGEQTYINNQFGYSFDFPSTYVAGIESTDTQDINAARRVELTGGDVGPAYAEISISVLSSDQAVVIEGASQESPLAKVQRANDYLFVSKAASRPHNDQSNELRAVSIRHSSVMWSEDGETSPLIITIQTIHSSQYDEVNFAYNYKYHEFLEQVIIDTLKVDQSLLKANQNN